MTAHPEAVLPSGQFPDSSAIRANIGNAKIAIQNLYSGIQDEVNRQRSAIDQIVFSRADQAVQMMKEHGVSALTEPESASLIYDSAHNEGFGLSDVEEALENLLQTIPFVTGSLYVQEDEATGNSVQILSIAIPDYPSETAMKEAAATLDRILQTQRTILGSTWVHVDVEKSSNSTCFIRADEHGYSLAKGDPTGLYHLKRGPVTGTEGLSLILHEIALHPPAVQAAS